MISNKIQKDIKILAIRLLLAELILGVAIFSTNYFLDWEGLYNALSKGNFVRYDLFSVITFWILELVTIVWLIWGWQKKFLRIGHGDRLAELLDGGENEKLELKASMRWDMREQKYNKELEKAIIKSVAGFLNSEGGVLVVGVTDNKEIQGLEDDYKTLPKANRDSWENHLNQGVKNYLGLQLRRLIRVGFTTLNKKEVAVVEVSRADKPVYFRDGESEQFYVRTGNSTNALSISEATEYIEEHWRKKKK